MTLQEKAPQEYLELARRGNPEAIAHLLNRVLQPKGITARASCHEACLRILLEAEQIPEQAILVAYLQKSLEKLNCSSLHSVQIYGKQSCASKPAWSQGLTLQNRSNGCSAAPDPTASHEIIQSPPTPKPAPPSAPLSSSNRTPSTVRSPVLFGVVALTLILFGANLNGVFNLVRQSLLGEEKMVLEDGAYQAQIIRREGGTPVIQVTFNGKTAFPMIVDTGASGTLITPEMAIALGVNPVGQVGAYTPSGYAMFDLGYMESIEVDGARITNVPVVIGPPDLTVGLLGHDFFGDFDVTVRQDSVEFRPR